MSFASAPQPQPERRRRVTELAELRALAHPLRLALLDQLMSFGAQTAAQCAAGVGSTTSNCSYHLRALGRVGLAERVKPSADGRERPWRATATGISYGSGDETESPAAVQAALALDELSATREEALARQARRRHAAQPEPWRAAEAFHEYALRVTAEELSELTGEIDRLLRPYIGATRPAKPQDAAPVRVRLQAFRDPRSA
jgi:predicted ArsR family transcriptional regulator